MRLSSLVALSCELCCCAESVMYNYSPCNWVMLLYSSAVKLGCCRSDNCTPSYTDMSTQKDNDCRGKPTWFALCSVWDIVAVIGCSILSWRVRVTGCGRGQGKIREVTGYTPHWWTGIHCSRKIETTRYLDRTLFKYIPEEYDSSNTLDSPLTFLSASKICYIQGSLSLLTLLLTSTLSSSSWLYWSCLSFWTPSTLSPAHHLGCCGQWWLWQCVVQ